MVSIIVPVYNVEKYLAKCINSITKQTFHDFELLLIDDGSTDESGKICDAFAERDTRIRVVHQKNKGLSGARNTGLSLATGEYITYIDSDDSVEPEYLEVLYRIAARGQASVSVCNYSLEWENDAKKQKRPTQKQKGGHIVRLLTGREAAGKIVKENQRNMIMAWGKLYHRDLRNMLIYPEGKTHEDEFVTYRVLYAAKKVAITDRSLYHYLQRGNSIMNGRYHEKRLHKLEALKEAVSFFRKKKDREMEISALKRYLLNLQIAWYRVSVFMPEREDLRERLKKEWRKTYRKYKRIIFGDADFTERISILVFSASPWAYGLIAGFYLRVFPEA